MHLNWLMTEYPSVRSRYLQPKIFQASRVEECLSCLEPTKVDQVRFGKGWWQ